MIKKYGFQLKGIHIHRTSKTRSLEVYEKLCVYVSKIIKQENLFLEYIDIGGGFYGHLKEKPNYEDYIKVIYDNLQVDKNIKVIIEPGNGVIASPVCFMSRIDIDPLFHKKSYEYTIFTENKKEMEKKSQIITGCTCLENDRLFEIRQNSDKLFRGDKIVIKDVGAYTMTLSPNFIRFQPNVYAYMEEKGYFPVRKKWGCKEIIQGFCYQEGE